MKEKSEKSNLGRLRPHHLPPAKQLFPDAFLRVMTYSFSYLWLSFYPVFFLYFISFFFAQKFSLRLGRTKNLISSHSWHEKPELESLFKSAFKDPTIHRKNSKISKYVLLPYFQWQITHNFRGCLTVTCTLKFFPLRLEHSVWKIFQKLYLIVYSFTRLKVSQMWLL